LTDDMPRCICGVTGAVAIRAFVKGGDDSMTAAERAGLTCPVGHYSWASGDHPPLAGFRQFDEGKDPVFFTRDASGYYVFTEQEAIAEGMQRPDLFSSSSIEPITPDMPYRWVPEMVDPPEHTQWRRLLAPWFTPGRAAAMTDDVHTEATRLIDDVVLEGHCDFVSQFARKYPTAIFLRLMGLPLSDLDMFLAYYILHGNEQTDPTRERAVQAMGEVMRYFGEVIDAARKPDGSDGTDIISAAVRWEIGGAPITDDDLMSLCTLMFVAGLDTVAAQLSYAIYTLATNPQLRQRIVDDPEVIPTVVEEFLRVHGIVQPGRKVAQDMVFRGCPLKKGDMVLFPLAAAGRDPRQYDQPAEIDFDRGRVRHISFGAGPHRCLGSHLARLELAIGLEEWHRRIPQYEVAAAETIAEHHSGVYGLNSLPLTWPPA
jgi:cytochrome P450